MTTAVMAKPETRAPRKASRESRREQLIEATIETIAANGLSRTTLTEVANAAGLSHGLVNFHFQSKDRLLAETLLYLSEEYRRELDAGAGGGGAVAGRAARRADPRRLRAGDQHAGAAQGLVRLLGRGAEPAGLSGDLRRQRPRLRPRARGGLRRADRRDRRAPTTRRGWRASCG